MRLHLPVAILAQVVQVRHVAQVGYSAPAAHVSAMAMEELFALTFDGLDHEVVLDLRYVYDLLAGKLGGARGVPNPLVLACIEPNVVQHYVSVFRILPRGVNPPMHQPEGGEGDPVPRQDPGPQGADGGAPWRGLSGVERAMMLRVYEAARKHNGMGAAIPHLGGSSSASGNASSMVPGGDPGTRALLEALQRNEARRQEREEGHLFKPSLWGDVLDDQDMLAFSGGELAAYFADYKQHFDEEPPLIRRPTAEQLTLFVRRLLPSRVALGNATGADFAIPFLDMAQFQPAGKSRKDRMKVERLIPQGDGTSKRVLQPGVPDYEHWIRSWELQIVCYRCLGPCLSQAAETRYLEIIQTMKELYPELWGIIVAAEELMRLERIPQIIRELRACPTGGAGFKALPLAKACSQVLKLAAKDREFWQTEVHDKCIAERTRPPQPTLGGRGQKRPVGFGEMEYTPGSAAQASHIPGWKGIGKGKSKEWSKGQGKNPHNPPGTKRTICSGYQGDSSEQARCSARPCPNICPRTNRPCLHICSKCKTDHPPPRGPACRR